MTSQVDQIDEPHAVPKSSGKTLLAQPILTKIGIVALAGVLHAVAFFGVGRGSIEAPNEVLAHQGAIYFLCFCFLCLVTLSFTEHDQETSPVTRFLQRRGASQEASRTGFTHSLLTTAYDIVVSIVHAAIFYGITYFAIGLQGNFGFWLVATVLFAQAQLAMGRTISVFVSNPKHIRQRVVPILLLVSALFSGAIVSSDEMPAGSSWVQYALPFTFYSRLALSTEFSTCMDFTDKQEQTLKCLISFRNALPSLSLEEGNLLAAILTDESRLVVPYTGRYTNALAIIEYNSYVSVEDVSRNVMLWNMCHLEEHVGVKVNSVSDDSCDVTVATVMQAQLNGFELKEENLVGGAPGLEFVKGRRVRYRYPEDLSGIEMDSYELYFPDAAVALEGDLIDPTKKSEFVCEVLEETCNDIYTANNFSSREDCVAQMAALPYSIYNGKEAETITGNSLGCRRMHAAFAVENQNHCPHLSLIPIPDQEGNLICQDESELNATNTDFFDEGDFDMFNTLAYEAGIDRLNHTRVAKEQDLEQCVESFVDLGRVAKIPGLPPSMFCVEQLIAKGGTGHGDLYYWAILLGMFVVFRLLAYAALSLKGSRKHQFASESPNMTQETSTDGV